MGCCVLQKETVTFKYHTVQSDCLAEKNEQKGP